MRSKLVIGGVAAGAALLIGTPLMAEAAGFIDSGDIVNSTIRSKDIKNGGVKGKDLANNTVTGAQVAENTLTGVNADTLDTLDSSALTTVPTVFNLAGPGAVQAGQRNWSFTVQPGTYLFSFATGINPTTDEADALCGFLGPSGNDFAWESAPRDAGKIAAWISASSVQTFATTTNLQFFCNVTAGSWTIDPNVDLQVSWTKINGTTPGTLTGRGAPDRPSGS